MNEFNLIRACQLGLITFTEYLAQYRELKDEDKKAAEIEAQIRTECATKN